MIGGSNDWISTIGLGIGQANTTVLANDPLGVVPRTALPALPDHAAEEGLESDLGAGLDAAGLDSVFGAAAPESFFAASL